MIVVTDAAELALPLDCLALVRTLLRQHAPKHQFFAFGSRVVAGAQDRNRVKRHSDLDIAIVGNAMPLEELFTLREAFSESELPMRVDLVYANDLPADWKVCALRLA